MFEEIKKKKKSASFLYLTLIVHPKLRLGRFCFMLFMTESPTWRFLIETKKENKEFLFPCELSINCYKVSKRRIPGESQKEIYRSYIYPIKQHDHNKYIQVNFLKGEISDM
ncbi:hypothetical protein HMI54_011870 [Coelomomyces lativittatus]|nr:hypothetical protein HMI54_011870 [Coelomomyces lativittatus]